MTLDDLRRDLCAANYRSPYPVDLETYERACVAVTQDLIAKGHRAIPLCGPHGGLMFKGVELVRA